MCRRLDTKPELFFTLRGVDMQDLITTASASATAPVASATDDALAGADPGEIFGIEMETVPPTAAVAPRKSRASKPVLISKKKNPPEKNPRALPTLPANPANP
jgi:uncharacterized Zn finger protein